MAESRFQSKLIRELRKMFPGCIIVKLDPNYLQGIPDLLILWKNKWAVLECKDSQGATRTASQMHYVRIMASMSFAAFIYPENKDTILDDLQLALTAGRHPRVSKPK